MSGLAYMPWYGRDFRSSTLTWSLVARAVYRELLDVQWDAGGLPDDAEQLRMLARASPKEWREAWKLVEPKFPRGADGLRRNPKLEHHRAESEHRREAASEHGRKGARGRWGNAQADAGADARADARAHARADARAMHSNSNSNTKPKSSGQGRESAFHNGGHVGGRVPP